jgi:hypothetical protein
LYESSTAFRVSGEESLLTDVRREFVTRHMKHLASKLGYNKRSIVLLAIFENILYDVVL